jgi:hypothetical protein
VKDFDFGKDTAEVFDNMLDRSGPIGILGRPGLLVLFSIPFFILYGVARFLKKTDRI